MRSDRQEPANCKTAEIHTEAEENRFSELKSIGSHTIQQNTFNTPDEDFGNHQGKEVLSEEKIQYKPEQGLCQNIYADACEQEGASRFPSPKAIRGDDEALGNNGNEKREDQFALERRRT